MVSSVGDQMSMVGAIRCERGGKEGGVGCGEVTRI
jgi:hypothetical protein